MRVSHLLAPLLALASLLCAVPAARAADEPINGGMFSAPGYPPGSFGTGGGVRPSVPSPTARPSTSPDGNSPPSIRGGNTVSLPEPQEEGLRRRIEQPRPSEFQKFVESATGRMLPLFGSSFFTDTDDFRRGSLENIPVSSDYTVGPGDEVVVRAWGSIDVDYRATVDRNGQINLPKVGSFSVAGVKASGLEAHLRNQIGRLFTNFNLNVALGQLRGVRVFIVGPASRPGVYTLPSQSTILSAVVAAGGPAPSGSMRKLSLRREGRVISELDVYEFLVQGDKSKDLQLVSGDVVVFQAAGPRIALTGATDTPAIYELKGPQEPVRDLLRYAGGAPVLANPHRAHLERIDPAQSKAARFVEDFKLDGAGLAKTLRDGDILTLLAISPQFSNAVTLRGHVAQPLRYPFKPGMRISDLIPDKDALISPDFYRRKNLLVQIISEEEEAEEYERRYGRPPPYGYGRDDYRRDRGRDGSQRNGVDERGNPVAAGANGRSERGAGNEGNVGGRETRADGSRYYDPEEDYAYERGRRPNFRVREARDVAARTTQSLQPLFDELNWDYAVIERLNQKDLTTQVISFNLGRAVIKRDPGDDVELLPGDVVTVYSQKDVRVPAARQTKLVSVEGEVGAPGVYQLLPGETLQALITRAGGFTPQAYVYGLEFSREETRRRQRENISAAIARLESSASTQAARDAANRDERTAALASQTIQAQMTRLRRLQPNGRIALELSPTARGIEELPNLPLEHADRINVPQRPGFVTVAGAVANNNAFIWKQGRTAGDYVRLAGVDEAADPSNIFVLRADGTVTSVKDTRGFFSFGGLDSQVLNPGDAVIVPNQLDYETWGRFIVRNLKDFSLIFSQIGLGAAAIHTLRN